MNTEDFRPEKEIKIFYPPQRVLMGPGPSDTHPRVLNAMARPTLGHLDPVFTEMMEEIKSLMRYAFQTKNRMTFPVSGPGSVGMEMCFVNMIEPGDKVIVCRNGVFGGRMIENVERHGGVAVVVEDKWGEPVDPQKVEDALKKNPDAKIVAFVHAETSTGAQSDLDQVTKIAYSMVSTFGMNSKVGNVSFLSMSQDNFTRPFSEETAKMMDEEVRLLIDTQYQRAQQLLTEKKLELDTLANELLKKEVLLKSDVERLIGPSPYHIDKRAEPVPFAGQHVSDEKPEEEVKKSES